MDVFTRDDALSIKPAFFEIYEHAAEMWQDFQDSYVIGRRIPARTRSCISDEELDRRGIDWRQFCLENIVFNW